MHAIDPIPAALTALGWSDFFDAQLEGSDSGLVPARVSTVHRARMTALGAAGPIRVGLPHRANTGDYAVGDWILTEPGTGALVRLLGRKTLLQRRGDGGGPQQLIAANIDTLFIVTSCNDDFNPARLERYLAVANEAGTTPVIVLSKVDRIDDAAPYLEAARALQRGIEVVGVNGTDPAAAGALGRWLGIGQTVALVGSSGVGKSSLLNTLAQKTAEEAQLTGAIREDDAKGRHTTTARSLHAIAGGAMVIDTPGMRSLYISDLSTGLDQLFAEIAELAPECRFRDCTHAHEPGCAVQDGVRSGRLDSGRLERWRQLHEENLANTPVETGPRGNKKGRRR